MYIYILRCRDDSLYTGITVDMKRRLKQHLGLIKGGAKYTKSHPVIYIEAVWQTDSETFARKLEYRLKQLNREQKNNILSNPNNIIEEYCSEYCSEQYKEQHSEQNNTHCSEQCSKLKLISVDELNEYFGFRKNNVL